MIEFLSQYGGAYLRGLLVALFISIIGMAIALALGTIGALARRSDRAVLRTVAATYVAVFRALPPLLMLFLVYFGLPAAAAGSGVGVLDALTNPLNDRTIAAIVAFGITSGAYTTEILRAGIAAISEEQREAARSLGMPYLLTFRRVIAPQALRIAFPPLSNEYISLLKATSLASVIGVVELLRQAQLVASATFENLLAYSVAGIYYILLVLTLQVVLAMLESRFPGPKPPRRRVISERILRRPPAEAA